MKYVPFFFHREMRASAAMAMPPPERKDACQRLLVLLSANRPTMRRSFAFLLKKLKTTMWK